MTRFPYLTLLSSLLALSVTATAAADARADLVDVRRGAYPIRHELLGWRDDGAAVFRSLVCDEDNGATATCNASIITALPDGRRDVVTLLNQQELYCGPGYEAGDCIVDGPAFVSAERRALAALPPLRSGRTVAIPAQAMGTLGGGATEVRIRIGPTQDPELGEVQRARLELHGGRGATVRLADLARSERIDYVRQVAAYASPSGEHVAFVVGVGTGMMCWGPFHELAFVVVDRGALGARLVNISGLRAYRAGDLAEAAAQFAEATLLDPEYALGWFNRAAVESLDRRPTQAERSLQRAVDLDPALARRACEDADFDALRRARPGALSCGAR